MKKLIYSNSANFDLKIDKKNFYILFDSILRFTGYKLLKNEQVSINFISQKKIAEINETFVHHTGATDVITFNLRNQSDEISDPMSDNIAAEIFISPEQAFIESSERKIQFSEELTLYIVHGILHLSGYDDIKIKDAKKMRKAEARVMKNLKSIHSLVNIFKLMK